MSKKNIYITRKDVTNFWRENIGILDHVRWDLFEENIRVYMEGKIDLAKLYFKQINLNDFFKYIQVSSLLFVILNPIEKDESGNSYNYTT